MTLRLEFTESAKRDLEEIDAQTIELFGLLQAERTAEDIEKAFDLLCENPRIGRLREDLSPKNRQYRMWVVLGRFVIIYEPNPDAISVVRVVDGKRDLRSLMERDFWD